MHMHVGGLKVTWAVVLLTLSWGNACSDVEAPEQDLDPSIGRDAGDDDTALSHDAGAGPDAGAVRDAGEAPDTGAARDAGEAPDAGGTPDAGEVQDASEAPHCDGVALGATEERTRYAEAEAETCEAETQTRTCHEDGFGAWTGSYGAQSCMEVDPPSPCDAEQRTRYRSASVPFGQVCESETQTRSCDDGDWSGTFEHDSCMVEPAMDCGAVVHGQSETRVRYEAASVPYGDTCREETQEAQCDNGALVGWTGTFTFDGCSVRPPAGCGSTPHGQAEARVRYLDPTPAHVACNDPSNAESQTRTCDNGVFGDWTGSLTESECHEGCGGLRHGQINSRRRWQAPTVPWYANCTLERQEQQCLDGELTPWTGSFSYTTCAPVDQNTDCETTLDGEFETRVRYASASVAGPESCVGELQERQCVSGTFQAWSGTYEEPACEVQSGFAGSCVDATASRCSDFDGTAHGAASVQAECEGKGGSYSSTACETSTAVGHCAIGDESSLVTTHDLPPMTALASQDACLSARALWTP